MQAGDREAAPFGSDILTPRRPTLANGQMPCGDVAFDADLTADVLGNLTGAPTLDAGDVKLRKPAVGHMAMIAARTRIGYAGASSAVCWSLSNASAGPNQLKNLRGRYGSAGNKDDRFDTFVLADTLRTDRARLRPLAPDSESTVALRALCRARKDLVAHRVRVANQLREHLNRVFPGAVGLFTKLDSPISLTFLSRFDCQDRADWLTPRRLQAWLASAGYCGRTDPAVVFARLSAAPCGLPAAAGAAQIPITRALVATLDNLVKQIAMLSEQIGQQLNAHADAHIFTNLPHVGTVRAARLLAEIGDCRGRFPTPEALACLAGVAPSTRQSGKMRSVGFRWAWSALAKL